MNDTIPKRWVGGVCIKDGAVLLIHRINKERVHNQEYFIFPGRYVQEDETLEEAITDHFHAMSVTAKLRKSIYSKGEGSDETEDYYLCEYLFGEAVISSKLKDDYAESGEQYYTPLWIPLGELDELIVYPEEVKRLVTDIDPLSPIENN